MSDRLFNYLQFTKDGDKYYTARQVKSGVLVLGSATDVTLPSGSINITTHEYDGVQLQDENSNTIDWDAVDKVWVNYDYISLPSSAPAIARVMPANGNIAYSSYSKVWYYLASYLTINLTEATTPKRSGGVLAIVFYTLKEVTA